LLTGNSADIFAEELAIPNEDQAGREVDNHCSVNLDLGFQVYTTLHTPFLWTSATTPPTCLKDFENLPVPGTLRGGH
jgi:hypothetical protein